MWLKYAIVSLLLCLVANTAHADNSILDHITLGNPRPLGSSYIAHEGPYKRIFSELSDYLEETWRDRYKLYYESGEIGPIELNRSHLRITTLISERRMIGKWWHRRWWWESMPEKRGGAPDGLLEIKVGRTFRLITTPLFTLDNTGNFRLREFQKTIDDKKPLIDELTSSRPSSFSGTGWLFKLRPKVRFSGAGILHGDFTQLFKSASLRIKISRLEKNNSLIDFDIDITYFQVDNELEIKCQITFVRW